MSYIKDSPDIPEKVEQELRNDNLVFFCGSGISIPNGLPSFKGLVEQVCQKFYKFDKDIGSLHPLLQEAYKKEDYDGMLDLIEGHPDFSVSRKILRKQVIEILNPHNLGTQKGSLDIHKALLDLSALPEGRRGHRLVTTNFDRLFFKAGLKSAQFDSAPKLAPPREETWQNLTFLHGVIDEEHDPEGKNLILTRRDFGLAYLHDNWASRFIIQLFQDWTVLFIGYSVNDPVMKYLVSAISYENQRRRENRKKKDNGSSIHQTTDKSEPSIYAFAGYMEDQKTQVESKEQVENKWKALDVEPILYKKVTGSKEHSLLYNTIKKWADLKSSGLSGRKIWLKEQLKSQYNKETDREKASNVISELRIDDKLAKYFPQIDFAPTTQEKNKTTPNKPVDISWLNAFDISKKRLDKPNFDPSIKKVAESNILEKLTRQTTKTNPPLWKSLSPLEYHIAIWLCYHLDKTKLIHWVIDKGCLLHPWFKSMIRDTIGRRPSEDTQKTTLQKNMNLFWETVTDNNYLKSICQDYGNVYGIIQDLNQQYSSAKAKVLLEILEPYIHFHTGWLSDSDSDFEKFTRAPEMKINAVHYPIPLKNESALLRHAEDFTDLLKKAMELAKKFEIIKNDEDNFFIIRPSIAEHGQNTTYHHWTYLIDLVRDSFNVAMKKDRPLADLLLQKWQYYPYSLFYRLILYAVTQYPELDEKIALNLLANETHNVLWSTSCQNEVCKYLRSFKNRKYSSNMIQKLLDLIMKGPPDSLFKDNVEDKIITEIKERDIYKRLECLENSGILFPNKVEKYYHEIQSKYSLKASKSSDIPDFPYFRTGIRSIPIDEKQFHKLTPDKIYDIIKNHKTPLWPYEKERVFSSLTEDNVVKAFKTLSIFSSLDIDIAPYWQAFFYGISSAKDQDKANEYFIKSFFYIQKFNNRFIKQCLGSLIDAVDNKGGLLYYKVNKNFFKYWWCKLWDLSIISDSEKCSKKESANYSMRAYNSKSGKMSHIIFKFLWSHFPEGIQRNKKIPVEIQYYFNLIIRSAKTNPAVMFHFGEYLFALWFLDREWTKQHIKPLMDWDKHNNICKSIWIGYFYHIKVNPNFLADFKKELLQMFLNNQGLYAKESDETHQLNVLESIAELFLIATGGKWFENIFTDNETERLQQNFIKNTNILESLSRKIWQLLKNSEAKSANLWDEKIQPWITEFWPAQQNMKAPTIAQNLSFAILYCDDKFPTAIEVLGEHIEGVITENHYTILYLINGDIGDDKTRFNYIFKHPHDLLTLLNWNFPQDDSIPYHYKEMVQKILKKLKEKHPDIEKDAKYTKLKDKIQ